MSTWATADKNAVIDTFYKNLFEAHPEYQNKFKFAGVPIGSLASNAAYKTQRGKTVNYVNDAVAGKADPGGLAKSHKAHAIGAPEFKNAKTCLIDAAKEHGCSVDLGPAVDAIINSF